MNPQSRSNILTADPQEGSSMGASRAPHRRRRENPELRKAAGQILSVLIVLGAAVLALKVWAIVERHPRTDDATVRANVIGVAPRVRGQIAKVCVEDNQAVKEGDVLFEIDPEDYRWTVEKTKSAVAALDRQIEVARSQDASLKFAVKAEEAAVERAQAQLKQASDSLHRLLPLLPKGFATAEQVEQAQTAERVADSALAAEEQRLNEARVALSTLDTLNAQRPGAVAAMKTAELELSYCRVKAPFPGRIVNLNLSAGAYVNVGVPVFSLLDTRKYYVMANFREGETRHIAAGAHVEVYLSSAPGRHFEGRVQGIGWAVQSEDEIPNPGGVPFIKRELKWVHVAQRIPVRIEIPHPDPELFHMGASAVAIVK